MRTPLFSTPLVEAEWLLANLQRVVLLDCRFSLADAEAGRRAYQNGHIPGAIYADLARDLSAPVQAAGAIRCLIRQRWQLGWGKRASAGKRR